MSLYQSHYRPAGLPKRYEATGIMVAGEGQAADIMRAKGVPERFGDPIDAVAYFDDHGVLGALVCDYANGRRVEFRASARNQRLSFSASAVHS